MTKIKNSIVEKIKSQINIKPQIGIILGSGLSNVAESVQDPEIIPYEKLSGWPVSTAPGHAGRLVAGILENQPVIVMQGRVHYYEGYSMEEVILPIRVIQSLGIEILIVTNAAGAINPDFNPGDIMLITDHIGLMSGPNPLIGPNDDKLGPRFPDMSQAYDRELNDMAHKVSKDSNIKLREGVYVGVSGPSFETPAELRFLRLAGADAVGMSTIPEVIVARHSGIRVIDLS